ncbi:MAG: alpha/beta fold hydrolase [Planctomycetes bacterium]|nr:alpha/beta fold hydrolase [Planctomycetota bacterium]
MSLVLRDLKSLYPFKSNYLTVEGRRLHYVDEGAGPVVLMLHGNPTWSFYYRDLIKGLRDGYRVVAPDHMGCGLSDKPQDYPYTLATHIANLATLIDHLELADITLAVHDWGGAIGFGWAMQHPELVRRLVLFNTAAFPGPCPLRIRMCRWPVFGDVAIRAFNAFARGAVLTACKKRDRMTPLVKRGYLLPYDSWTTRIANLRFVRDIPLRSTHPTYPLIKKIEASLTQYRDLPTLICWGGRDFCFHDWYLEEWRRRLPGAEVHRFDDAGHYVVEDAHERILPLLDEFLS